MRTNQIQGIIFTRKDQDIYYLLLKRNEQKGGFWQPITGGIEDDENPNEAILRELEEELSLSSNYQLIDINYQFDFLLENGNKLTEYVFGIEIPEKIDVILSNEHVDSKWVSKNEALKLLKWKSNKKALTKLEEYIMKENRKYA